MLHQETQPFYEFGSFRLDPAKRVLLMDENPVLLTPKAFDTLLVLVQNRGKLVEKDELMKMLWPDSFVEEANLAQNVSVLRKVLGESPHEHRYIVTVPGRGYRFVAEVRESRDEESEFIVEERTRSRIVINEEEKTSAPGKDGEGMLAPEGKRLTTGEVGSPELRLEYVTQTDLTGAVLGQVRLPRPSIAQRWSLFAGALAITFVALLAGWRLGWFAGLSWGRAPEFRQRQLTANPIDDPVYGAAISPDGKYLAYTDLTGIHLRLIATGEIRTLALPEGFCFR